MSWFRARILPAALIAVHLLLAGWAVFALAQTYDEAAHLASGYAFLKSGEVVADFNTPLAGVVAAMPLLALNPDSFLDDSPHKEGRYWVWADQFLYHNRISAETMLHVGRLAILLLVGLPLAWILYRWGESTDAGAGAAALFFYAFNPVVLSNVSLVTSDAVGALFVVLCLYAASWACDASPARFRRYALAGVFLGLALASKYSTVILLAALPLGAALRFRLARRAPGAGEALRAGLVVLVVALASLAVVYGPRHLPAWERGAALTFRGVGTGGALGQPLGNPAFLLGEVRLNGWWYYFLVALLVKTPLPLLLLCGAAVFTKVRERGSLVAFAALPACLWLGASCFSRYQVGVRHLFPVYPLVCLIAGAGFVALWRGGSAVKRACLGLLLVWYAWGTLRLAPDYLAYFNELAGGPEGGLGVLADSNLDWGQSLKTLGRFLHEEGDPPIYLSYFGTADPHAYGIRYVPVVGHSSLPRPGDQVEPFLARKVLFAVSATNYASVYYYGTGLNMARCLAAFKPYKVLGHSILIYDFTGQREALFFISQLLAGSGDEPRARNLRNWLDRTDLSRRAAPLLP